MIVKKIYNLQIICCFLWRKKNNKKRFYKKQRKAQTQLGNQQIFNKINYYYINCL